MNYKLIQDQKYKDRYGLSLDIGGVNFETREVRKKEEWTSLRKAKYFQLRERSDTVNSIGVISSISDKFDIDNIQDALESHFDDQVSSIRIEGWDDDIIISFNLESRDEREYVDGEQTWMYI